MVDRREAFHTAQGASNLGFVFFLYTLLSIIRHRFTLPEHFPDTTSDRRFLRAFYFVATVYAIARNRIPTAWQVIGAMQRTVCVLKDFVS